MGPKALIIGKNRVTGKIEILSDPNISIGETEEKFMPFRLNRINADYEWAALCGLNVERTERFDAPKSQTPIDSKKAKSK
jgi:hypothetical protein